MEFEKDILQKIDYLNDILGELGMPDIVNSNKFYVDNGSMGNWLKVHLVKSQSANHVDLSIECTPSGIEIGIDRINEALEWNNNYLNNSKEKVRTVIRNLFQSFVLVEYFGNSRTRISLFRPENGVCTNQFIYREGIGFPKAREPKLFTPIY